MMPILARTIGVKEVRHMVFHLRSRSAYGVAVGLVEPMAKLSCASSEEGTVMSIPALQDGSYL